MTHTAVKDLLLTRWHGVFIDTDNLDIVDISVHALVSCIALQKARSNHSMCYFAFAGGMQLIPRHVTIFLAKEWLYS